MEISKHLIESIRDNIGNELYGSLHLPSAKRAAADIMLIIDRLVAEDAVMDKLLTEMKENWPTLVESGPALKGDSELQGDDTAGSARPSAVLSESRLWLAEMPRSTDMTGRFCQKNSMEASWLTEAIGAFAKFTKEMEGTIKLTLPKEGDLKTENKIGERLSAYLAAKFPEMGDDLVLSVELLDGGKSKMTASARLRENAVLPRKVILRLDLGDTSMTGTVAAEEFPLLRALYDAGIPVPEPLLAELDPSWLGGSFLLMVEIEGAVLAGDGFPELGRRSDLSHDFGKQVAQVMAKFHGIESVPGWNRSGKRSGPRFKDVLEAFSELWRLSNPPDSWIGVDLGLAWLQSHPMPGDRPRCLVHSDMGAQNILTRDGNLDVVLDWELAHMGDPAEDLGFCRLILLEGQIRWNEFITEYRRAGGREAACDPYAVSFYGVWAWTRVTIQVAMLLKSFESGSRNDTGAARAMDAGSRLLRYLARELEAAVALHKDGKEIFA